MTATNGWQNSEILGRYDAETIRDLKQHTDGNLYVSGSGTLVRALLADHLIDELNLFVFTVVLGAGARLFAEGTARTSLTLLDQTAYDNGVLHLTYTPAADG